MARFAARCAAGLLDETHGDADDLKRVRGLPSAQLVGHPMHVDLDINTLADQGVNIVGRLVGVQGRNAQFSGSLAGMVKMGDLKQQRLLHGIDEWIDQSGADVQAKAASTLEPTRVDSPSRLTMPMGGSGIRIVIWSTGFRPDYSWIKVPLLDRKGRLVHEGGVTSAPWTDSL